MILIIGWRGSPRIKDEPQHNVKGKITEQILKLLNIKYTILRTNADINKFKNHIIYAKKNKSVVACLIEKETLDGEEFVSILSKFTIIPEKERTPQLLN